MIVIPDLFGSYQKGREAAIEANWKDLQNYESIENARHQNDAAALANLATMADFGKQRRLTDNQVTNSDLNTEYNVKAQIGKLFNVGTDNLIAGTNNAILMANRDVLTDGMANNLLTWSNNALTGANNSGTNVYNSSIIYGTTANNYEGSFNAADAAMKAKIDIQTITAQYGPAATKQALDLQLKQGLITDEQYNQEMTRLRAIAPYVGPTATYNAQAGLQTAKNSVGQAENNGQIIANNTKTFELNNRLVQLTNAYQAELATGGPDTPRARDLAKRISETYDALARSAGVTGSIAAHTPTSIPIVDPNNGVYLGNMDTATGAVTRSGNTAGVTATTGNLFSASPPVRSISQIAADNVGRTTVMTGTPLISLNPTATQQTTTATHYLPNGQRVVTKTPVKPSNQALLREADLRAVQRPPY